MKQQPRNEELKQSKQYIPNPQTGEMMEVNTFSGKELFWRETNENNEES
ncbi:hypothetical protein [Ammoniphilus sp. 3BR4]